jgi:Protein of unknown function (DUF4232)
MAARDRLAAAAGALVLCALAASAGAGAAPSAPSCRGADLSVAFRGIPGSAGAGNISYVLQIRNRSHHACFVSGVPAARLLGRLGKKLPTHVLPAPPRRTAHHVVLRPGRYAAADARFSPDVPGPGEPVVHVCERTAYRIRLTAPGGGTTIGPIVPPTPVCEHGTMFFSVFVAGKRGPSQP